LRRSLFVADRGLFSEDNLKLLEEKKFKYIVGARIKNLSKKLTNDILNTDNYQAIDIKFKNKKNREEKAEQRIASFEHKQGRQLVVHYSSKRACKDEYDRNKSLEKLQKKLAKSKDPKSLLNNTGYKKFLNIKGDAEIGINADKIGQAAAWDGLMGVITNDKEAC